MKKVHQKTQKSKRKALISPLAVSLDTAGTMLELSARTIRRMSQIGTLPPIIKIGHSARISYQGLLDYMANGGRGTI